MALKIEGICPLLEVFDMPKAIAFYCNLLGFEVVATSRPGNDFDWALLRLDDAELMLNTAYEKHERPADSRSGPCRRSRRYRAILRLSRRGRCVRVSPSAGPRC
jgi:catechol 2,3-dioxygenase-like lactoylglutathione lyase family enzyme